MSQAIPSTDRLNLSHGQARWVLTHLGLHAGEDEHTFDAYLKSLRRDGVPFAVDELGVGAGYNLSYHYPHLMELAVALAWRTQGILSRHIVALLADYRPILRQLYRRAWLERNDGLGTPRNVLIDATTKRAIRGTYLSLELNYTPLGILQLIQPKLLSPLEAFDEFMGLHQAVYPRPPLPISQIADDVVRLAENAPEIKRGRRS